MPFEIFDRSRLNLLPLAEREHDLDLSVMVQPSDIKEKQPTIDTPDLDKIAQALLDAQKAGASTLLMMGAHVIRSGMGPLIIDWMERGLIKHVALNGAGAIHDFEFAMIGATTESVARYITEGQFGLWNETGTMNDTITDGVKKGLGLGESLGCRINTNPDSFPYRDISVLAAGQRLQVPVTVHVGIGCDIIHEHPNCDGASLGAATYTDFLIYARTIENLTGGVFLNFGSAVIGPEVYLKCLSMARNIAHQEGRKIIDFTTAVFDLIPSDGLTEELAPDKSDHRYYFRPWKTILARTVAEGGRSYYIQGRHADTLSSLWLKTQ